MCCSWSHVGIWLTRPCEKPPPISTCMCVGDAIGTSQLKSTPRMAPAVDLHCLAEIHDQIAQPQEARDWKALG